MRNFSEPLEHAIALLLKESMTSDYISDDNNVMVHVLFHASDTTS